MNNDTVHDHSEPLKTFEMDLLGAHYSLSFQVTLTSFLIIEILLGLSSNLTVLALYCMKSNLISSVSSIVTMNLHVLDVLVCIGCVPFTIAVVLLPLEEDTALVYCFHEACVSFASIATAANVLAITLDRYDISVRPANRVLTIERTVVLLGSIWALSLLGFLVPFIEVGFLKQTRNHTIEMENTEQGYTEAQLYYHLLAQIPIFVFTAVSMLVTYYKILQAFNIHIGTRFHKTPKKKSVKKQSLSMTSTQTESTEASERGGPNAIIALRRATEVSESRGGPNPALGSSVSAIITLRRAIKRHRERRERQRRVFKMSLLIITSFLLCWTPITIINTIFLSSGHNNFTMSLRLGFLAMAYGTTVFHPLLYAFTRQKLQNILKSKMRKPVVSVVEADPVPTNTVTRNSNRVFKKGTFERSTFQQKCFSNDEVD